MIAMLAMYSVTTNRAATGMHGQDERLRFVEELKTGEKHGREVVRQKRKTR